MSAPARLELRVEHVGERVRLTSPGVGLFTCAARIGRALTEGQTAGSLVVLGRAYELVVPAGIAGRITSSAPEQVHAPVGFGATLYELAPLHAGDVAPLPASKPEADARGALVFRSPQSGRFWHRSVPTEPALVSAGMLIESGQALGLIEVMKTFTLVGYAPGSTLPARARVVRVLAADGAEVAERAPLLELEPA